jgi:hypothetical protein
MKRKLSLLFSFILFCFPAYTHAQAWSGVVNPSRAIDWSNVGIPGGIPVRNAICASLTSSATASQINNAIASCPSGQVVSLASGTYNLSAGIDFAGRNNVTLRGAGPTQTRLVFAGGTGCGGPTADVCIEGSFNWNGGPQQTTTWTGGYAPGTTQITLGSTAGLSVGQVLILDQDNDTTDTNQVFVCDTTACASDNSSSSSSPGRNCSNAGTVSGCSSGAAADRNQQQYVRVTAINGNTVTISPGLYMPNWRASQNPGAWWASAVIQGSGIENLTVDNTNSNDISGIMFFNAYQCWMKNVRSLRGNRNHVWLEYSARIVIRDSYFFGTLNALNLSYGIEPWQSGDVLVENNIFSMVTNPILIGNTSGSVFSYNYDINNYYSNPTWMMPGPAWAHDAGTSMNLIEGNIGPGFVEDDIHGSHNFATVFRNLYSGLEPGKLQQTVPIILQSHSRYDNLIGNVLGTAGYHNTYQSNTPATTSACDASIYNLGWSDPECKNLPQISQDPMVISTLMRWGNYDVVNGAVQWNSSEVPSGISSFSNALPASRALPNSFYLPSLPAAWWATAWGTPAWPPIGPDVTGGNVAGLGGHVNKTPAQLCYGNLLIDAVYGNGILAFDASACYTATPRPVAPTNLAAIVN